MANCVGKLHPAFQDTTAVPLLFVQTLSENGVTSADPNFGKDGTMYVLLFTVFISFFKWTIAYRMMERYRPTLVPEIEGEILPEVVDHTHQKSFSHSGRSVAETIIQLTRWQSIKKSLNPPVYAVFLALPLALIPHVSKTLFLSGGAVFKDNVFAGLDKIGTVTTVSILLILGQNLSRGYPPNAYIKPLELWSTVIGRLIVMPLIGMGIFLGLYHKGFCVRTI